MRAPGAMAHGRMTILFMLALVSAVPVIRAVTADVFCGQTSSSSDSNATSNDDSWPQPRANVLSSRCNGVCGSDSLCVFRPEPLVGCDADAQGQSARCVNGATCAYECLAVLAKATSWSITWREDNDTPTVVTITTALVSGEPTIAYVSGPIESIDDLELPKTVVDLYVHCCWQMLGTA